MRRIQQNQTAEWSFTSTGNHRDPFNEVELTVRFRHADGEELLVPAFWAGGRDWRVRFATPVTGRWHFETVCSAASDAGLHGQAGDFSVARYAGKNPLYRHGPVGIAAGKRHFAHADGTPFLWLGDTWWMGLCQRLSWPKGFKPLVQDRVSKGFTVVQIVAGLYPDMAPFDPRGANEAGFPWEQDYARINPAYFDQADRRIQHLVDSGLAPCIVACWGYFLPWLGVEKMKKHWRNLVARYGSYPVIWCLAGEGTMAYYLSPNYGEDSRLQKRGWNELGAYLRTLDPYHRPITMHPSSSGRKELQEHPIEAGTRVLTTISAGWRFKTDPADHGETQSWQTLAVDESWKPIHITRSWTAQGYDYYGVAWYTVECAVPQDVRHPVRLFFRAVDGTARVWIDGDFAGEQTKPAAVMWNEPWALDVTRLVASKKAVRITVKVVKEQFGACGIYQPVELREEVDRGAAVSASVLDFDMLQTGHGDRSSVPVTVKFVSAGYRTTPPMPVVEGEVCYEGIGGFCREEVQRWLFWACMLNGAAGFTYGANGIWQVNTRAMPYGPSPHGMSWGDTPWEDAYRLAGSEQLGLAKRLLSRYRWWEFEPHPEWVEPGWTDDLHDEPFTCGRHDVPMAAGIPGKVRIIYRPMGRGLRVVKGLEDGVRYRFGLYNPVDGTDVGGGDVHPDASGDWNLACPGLPSSHLLPIFQDWVLVLEAAGARH
jgi:hypothetical protein